MTLTIIGRCEAEQLTGIALSSSPLSVTARCAFIKADVGAVSTQASTDPGLGPLAVTLLETGYSPESVLSHLRGSDALHEWRQIGIVDKHGRSAAYTGANTMQHRGHIAEKNFVAMGNGLASPDVWPRMAQVFQGTSSEILEDRLLLALEAGRDAGGDLLGHLSAGLVVFGKNSYPRTDLRVDMHLPLPGGTRDAVSELRRIVEAYKPMIEYYEHRPCNVDTVDEWIDWLVKNDPRHLRTLVSQLPDRAQAEVSTKLEQLAERTER